MQRLHTMLRIENPECSARFYTQVSDLQLLHPQDKLTAASIAAINTYGHEIELFASEKLKNKP